MKEAFSYLLTMALLLGLPLPLLAATQETQQEAVLAAQQTAMTQTKSLLDYFQEGGIFMYPILLTSIFALAVAVYCSVQIRRERMMPALLLSQLKQLLAEQRLVEAFQLCQAQANTLATVIENSLIKANESAPLLNKAGMEAAAEGALDAEETKLGVWVNYLNVCAQIAPMLGLFGTVVGMIDAFNELAAGRAEPSDLASGIGVAMLTTAGGLVVAIPSMAVYFYFRGTLTTIMTNMQKQVNQMFDILTRALTTEEPPPATEETPTPSAPLEEMAPAQE